MKLIVITVFLISTVKNNELNSECKGESSAPHLQGDFAKISQKRPKKAKKAKKAEKNRHNVAFLHPKIPKITCFGQKTS